MQSTQNRFFFSALLFGSGLVGLSLTVAHAAAVKPETFTYKRVGTLGIKADVYRTGGGAKRPVVVWIHGGALIMGHRGGIDRRVRKSVLDAGYVLVSIDYRLAPETKLPDIIGDLEDAFAWIHNEGPRLFHADTTRVAVMGGSAGGYLTLTAGFRVVPRPTVLVCFWGYGDLVGDWYSRPSPHARHRQITISKAEAFRQVSGPAIADARDRQGDGGAFYQYCRQHGAWPEAVSGWDPHTETGRFVPYMPVRNVTAEFPPTVLLHGTEDTDVPFEQSAMMAKQLAEHGVEHDLIAIPRGEHGLAGGDPAVIEDAYRQAFDFAHRHLKSP